MLSQKLPDGDYDVLRFDFHEAPYWRRKILKTVEGRLHVVGRTTLKTASRGLILELRDGDLVRFEIGKGPGGRFRLTF